MTGYQLYATQTVVYQNNQTGENRFGAVFGCFSLQHRKQIRSFVLSLVSLSAALSYT